jgi:molecular chaperone DnaK
VETLGAVMTSMIPRNTTIPTRREEVFSTAEDNQGSVEIHVLQGERASARDNRTLGRFRLEGIMPAPRGVPKIRVTFDIDANGILSVTAKDEATGKDQKITITANSGLAESEIEKMVKDAQAHEEEDKRRREEVETRNKADQLVYSVERMLGEMKDKLPQDKIGELDMKAKSLREAIDKQEHAAIKSRMADLEKTMEAVAKAAYQQTGGGPAGGAPGGGAAPGGKKEEKKDEGVIDAEFEDAN